MLEQLKKTAEIIKTELKVYRLAMSHERTPKAARILLGLALGYTLMPFDIIPDFIPVIGHIDDVIVVPLLIVAALGMIPVEVMQECREKASNSLTEGG
jgi:uncharacterized membrane protein YkvA (DUF1232 family)